jgi:hypothetical protein
MSEQAYLEDRLNKMREAQGQIPDTFKKYQDAGDREIQALIAKAGIADQIEAIKAKVEEQRKRLQKESDVIAGRMAEVQLILEKFHFAPIPEGVTHMHGIELAPLDWQTRLLVMQGNEDTIITLGGSLEKPTRAKRSPRKA